MNMVSKGIRSIDSKGRLTLGESFANRTVLVEERDGEIIVRLARVVPEREAWLYENEEALASVRRGLQQARAARFAKKSPDLKASARLSAELED